MKKYSTLIFLGIINILHASAHILQAIQSFFLFSYATNHKENWVHKLMENPYMAILWAVLGIGTLYLGIRDYRHHKKHKD